jgi:hypothetical protein
MAMLLLPHLATDGFVSAQNGLNELTMPVADARRTSQD